MWVGSFSSKPKRVKKTKETSINLLKILINKKKRKNFLPPTWFCTDAPPTFHIHTHIASTFGAPTTVLLCYTSFSWCLLQVDPINTLLAYVYLLSLAIIFCRSNGGDSFYPLCWLMPAHTPLTIFAMRILAH